MASITRSKNGQSEHYSTDNHLAHTFGVDELTNLGTTDGPVSPAPFTVDADGWNHWKNVYFIGNDPHAYTTHVTLTDFVHVDIDDSANDQGRAFTVENAKRGNILLGDGDDTLTLSLATNGDGWSNKFYIDTAGGDDTVTIAQGVAQTGSEDKTHATITDGRFTTTHVKLGEGDDTFTNLTEAADVVGGQAGDDDIDGGAGNDRLFGSKGEDNVKGGAGDDFVDGNQDNDVVSGGAGNDEVSGGAGDDVVNGDAGNDLAYGGKGADMVNGGDGNDTLWGDQNGGEKADGDGNDVINGGDGNDEIGGQGGDDTINGDAGNDRLFGSHGDDIIDGGDGDDFIRGNQDDDTLTGGEGSDTFDYTKNDGADVITDFDIDSSDEGESENDSDTLSFTFGGQPYTLNTAQDFADFIVLIEKDGDGDTDAIQDGNDLILDFGGGNKVRLEGVIPMIAIDTGPSNDWTLINDTTVAEGTFFWGDVIDGTGNAPTSPPPTPLPAPSPAVATLASAPAAPAPTPLIVLADADGDGNAKINTGNKSSEAVTISLDFGFGATPSKQDFKKFDKNDGGVLSLHLGANKKVGGTDIDSNPDANEFRELTGGFLNVSWKSNEIQDLLDELIEGDGIDGVDLTFNSASSITLALDNGHATDFINLEGQYIEDYLASTPNGFDLFNKKDQVKVFCFDDPNKQEQIFSGRSDRLDDSPGAVGELFTSEINFLTEKGGELENIINAALDEKFGLTETKDLEYVNDDGGSIVVKVTNTESATDTLILKGGDVATLIDNYEGSFRSNLDTGDGKSRSAFYDADEQQSGGVFFGGGVNGVTFDVAGTITLNDVVGNGLTQKEDNPNREWQDDIDEFVFAALDNSGDADVTVIAGGEAGDDFLTVEMQTNGGNIDTLILQGGRIGDAIDEFAATGTEFDFFA